MGGEEGQFLASLHYAVHPWHTHVKPDAATPLHADNRAGPAEHHAIINSNIMVVALRPTSQGPPWQSTHMVLSSSGQERSSSSCLGLQEKLGSPCLLLSLLRIAALGVMMCQDPPGQ